MIQGISVRQNDVWRQWLLWPSCDRCYRTKRGQGEVSTNYIKDSFNLLSGSLNQSFHHHLGVWSHCSLWVPHQLTEKQRRGRVDRCLHVLRIFDGGRSEWVWDIKTFVYRYPPETKQQSSVWLFPGESPPVKFKRSRSTSKRTIAVFWAKSGHVASGPLHEKETVNSEWYINACLPKVFEAWSARRPNDDTL